jgi:hypothetical protein
LENQQNLLKITIMVTITIVSEYSSNPPTESGRVKIAGGPLYSLERVKALIQDENRLQAWTEKCRKDVRKWFDDDWQSVVDLLGSLESGDYIDSEWCENGKGAIAACDAYSYRVTETAPATGKPIRMDYFLKFAVSKTGTLVLMVSCHA